VTILLCKNRPVISTLYFQWPRKCERTDLDIMPLVCTVIADSYYYVTLYYWGEQWQTTPRTCPGGSVPEPYRSHDWALVPASPASKAEY